MALPARFTVTSLIGRRESVVVVDREDEGFVESVAEKGRNVLDKSHGATNDLYF